MKNKSILTRPLFSLILLITSSVHATDLSNRLTVDRYLRWEDISDAQLSPDGRQVIYSRRWVDPVNDGWDNSLWIINSDGTRNRFLVDGSSPRWSPDGTRVAFMAEGKTGGTQIFVRWMDAEGATSHSVPNDGAA